MYARSEPTMAGRPGDLGGRLGHTLRATSIVLMGKGDRQTHSPVNWMHFSYVAYENNKLRACYNWECDFIWVKIENNQ